MQQDKPKGPPRGTNGGRTPKTPEIGNRVKKSLMIDPDLLTVIEKESEKKKQSLSDTLNDHLRKSLSIFPQSPTGD